MSPARLSTRANLAARFSRVGWRDQREAKGPRVPVYTVVTPAQGDVLSAIASYQRHHDMAPSVADMCALLGVSIGTMHSHIVRLKLRGLVRWTRGKTRTLRLTGAPFVVVR